MSREDGFPIADVDTGLFSDTKVKALARRLRDPHLTAEYLCLWMSVLLDSWGEGDRVEFVDAVPAWFTDDTDEAIGHLTAVGMLVDEHIPPDSWEHWFGPAWDRREQRRSSGREGGLRSAKRRSTNGQAVLQHSPNGAEPVRTDRTEPSVPTDPPVLRAMRSTKSVLEVAEQFRKNAMYRVETRTDFNRGDQPPTGEPIEAWNETNIDRIAREYDALSPKEPTDLGSERGRLLAERDRLIAEGVEPDDLERLDPL